MFCKQPRESSAMGSAKVNFFSRRWQFPEQGISDSRQMQTICIENEYQSQRNACSMRGCVTNTKSQQNGVGRQTKPYKCSRKAAMPVPKMQTDRANNEWCVQFACPLCAFCILAKARTRCRENTYKRARTRHTTNAHTRNCMLRAFVGFFGCMLNACGGN